MGFPGWCPLVISFRLPVMREKKKLAASLPIDASISAMLTLLLMLALMVFVPFGHSVQRACACVYGRFVACRRGEALL